MKELIKTWFPFTVRWYFLLQLSLKEKKILPNRIKLDYSGNLLFADPFEARGLALLKGKATGQPFIKKFWRTALDLFQPEVALDVGANYGEVFLDANYPEQTKKVIGVEANPFLIKYLQKGKKAHRVNEKILVVNGLASGENTEDNRFFIDKAFSGRSTALENNFVKKSKEVSVNSYRMDDLILNMNLSVKNLVFKIDVEGFEPFVIEGMTRLMDSDINLIGCIEFNLTSLEKNGIDTEDYLHRINQHFTALILLKDGSFVDMKKLDLERLKKVLTSVHTEGDILLFTNPNQKNEFKNKFNQSNKKKKQISTL